MIFEARSDLFLIARFSVEMVDMACTVLVVAVVVVVAAAKSGKDEVTSDVWAFDEADADDENG